MLSWNEADRQADELETWSVYRGIPVWVAPVARQGLLFHWHFFLSPTLHSVIEQELFI